MSIMLSLLLLISLAQLFDGRPRPSNAAENIQAGNKLPPAQSNPAPLQASSSPWILVWSDEFNGADGSAPDGSRWTVETGGNGWGNHELEYYTNRLQNIQTQAGKLVITARHEGYSDDKGVLFGYTSARIKTLHKFEQAYGRFEARIQIPRGQGIWPAFWMLGNDIDSKPWPACGEIDIMENIGKEPATVHGTIHGPGHSGEKGIGSAFTVPAGKNFADDFHIYAVEWQPSVIRFYVDDHLYATRTPADLPSGAKWVYDHPFFILLNVAVGGDWPGSPDVTTKFPQSMFVDYVRVYKRAGP
jgi:beta-glucanase (GH16 family)